VHNDNAGVSLAEMKNIAAKNFNTRHTPADMVMVPRTSIDVLHALAIKSGNFETADILEAALK
jgi:hypothetical protein